MTQDESSEHPARRGIPDLISETSSYEEATSAEHVDSPTTRDNIVFARYKEGFATESQRISHVLNVPDSGAMPETLTALCGQQFAPNILELLQP